MELKITKEKVLEAASKCSDAKNVLQTMFPECFQDDYDEYVAPLAKLIDSGERFPYLIYRAMPGFDSTEKAKWLINQLPKLKNQNL